MELHFYLILVPDGAKCLCLSPCPLTLGGLEGESGNLGDEKNLLLLPQIEGNYHLSIPWPIHYTDCTIPAHNFADETENNHVNFNLLAGVLPEI